jgi:tetratricopeptide (TPR) repeat protein/tRNA A-37 threonylcarbamoyl transferase component Bud32
MTMLARLLLFLVTLMGSPAQADTPAEQCQALMEQCNIGRSVCVDSLGVWSSPRRQCIAEKNACSQVAALCVHDIVNNAPAGDPTARAAVGAKGAIDGAAALVKPKKKDQAAAAPPVDPQTGAKDPPPPTLSADQEAKARQDLVNVVGDKVGKDADSAGPAGQQYSPEAVRTLNQFAGEAARLPKSSPSALNGYGRFALSNGDAARAEKLANAAIQTDGSNTDSFGIRSAARLSLGNLSGAKEDAKKALELDPTNKFARTVGQFAQQMETDPSAKPPDPSKLIRDFGSASAGSLGGGRSAAPVSVVGGANVASLGGERAGSSFASMSPSNKLAAAAEEHMKIGDLKTASLEATKAIEADKSNPEAYAVRAGIWNKQQRYLNAQADANTALGFDPSYRKALNARSFAYNMTGHPQEAQVDANKVLAQDPHDALGCLNLAMSEESLGDVTKANANYQKAAALDPSYKPLYDDFLSKHPELLGGGGAAPSSPLRLLPPALRSTNGLGAAGLAVLALGAAAALFRKKDADSDDDEVHGAVPAPSPRKAPTQGAETIVTPSSDRTVPSEGGAPTLPSRAGTTLRSDATVPAPELSGPNGGRLIARTYEIRKELGRGGMGVVYEAFDTALKRKVALKEMRSEIAQSTRDKERFLAEARTVAKFQHPNIVSIYNILEEGHRTFLVFEHVQGGGLDGLLDQRRKLDPAAAVPLLKSIAAALDYSHSRKVIHRDLKPSNIMITEEGIVKVMDFGIAHEAKQTVSRMTNAEAFGTMAYMPPEQELGQASRESDVFAFAVLAYETLLGTMPFPGPNFLEQKKAKKFQRPSQADPTLPASLDAVFEKALEPEPKNRYRSAGDFAEGLSRALGVRA